LSLIPDLFPDPAPRLVLGLIPRRLIHGLALLEELNKSSAKRICGQLGPTYSDVTLSVVFPIVRDGGLYYLTILYAKRSLHGFFCFFNIRYLGEID
jgi:hypothetical protein